MEFKPLPRLVPLQHLLNAGISILGHGLVRPREKRVEHDAVVGHVLLCLLRLVAEGAPEEGFDFEGGVVVALGDCVEALAVGHGLVFGDVAFGHFLGLGGGGGFGLGVVG